MAFDPARPYDDLPPMPPSVDVETAPVLKQCLRATRALAELKGAGGLIPDQAILINSIPLQEAQASSEIENILTTQDALFRAELNDAKTADPQTKEVLRYRTALRRGYETVRDGSGIRALGRFVIPHRWAAPRSMKCLAISSSTY